MTKTFAPSVRTALGGSSWIAALLILLSISASLLGGTVGLAQNFGCSSFASDVGGLQLQLPKIGWYTVTVSLETFTDNSVVSAQLMEFGPNLGGSDVAQAGLLSQGSHTTSSLLLAGSKTWSVYSDGTSSVKIKASADGPATIMAVGTSITVVYAGVDDL